MPGVPAGPVLRYARLVGVPLHQPRGRRTVFLVLFYALARVWEYTGNCAGHVLPRIL